MEISSEAFQNNQNIPAKYTCDGQNINPPLELKGVSDKAQSLVLICDDPDAPGGTWTHWTVWNINSRLNKIEENSVPEEGIEGKTSKGDTGYHGPCPPSGSHRYFFRVFALDAKLSLASNADIGQLQKAMEGHILEQAELVGLYQRNE